jgi:hypothetical protein
VSIEDDGSLSVGAREFVETMFAGPPSPLTGEAEFHVIASNPVVRGDTKTWPARLVSERFQFRGESYVNWATAARVDAEDGKGPRVRAIRDAFGLQYFLMLDDVGHPEKSRLSLESPEVQAATYVLETSEGNHQVGYRLAQPIGLADNERLRAACIEAGLADKGSLQNPHRWCRVPGSVNTKPGRNGWKSRLVLWGPENRFTLEELCTLLGIKLGAVAVIGKPHPSRRGVDYSRLDEIPDRRFQALRRLPTGAPGSLLKPAANTEGFFPIVCPWYKEHSGEDQTGTAYRPSAGSDDAPAFVCQHSHGQVGPNMGRCGTAEFLRWVDAESPEPIEPVEIPGPGPFPADDLPSPVGDMVREIARSVQVDPAMAGGHAIGLLAACVMRQCRVREKPGLESYLTQFIVTGAESGERKSAVHRLLVDPIDVVEREWQEEDQKARSVHEARIAGIREEANVKKRTAGLKDTPPEEKAALLKQYADLVRQAKELERQPPTERRVYLDDVTEASFVSNLRRAGGAVSLVSPEGRGFISTLLGYYSRGEAKDAVFLQAYSGDTIKVARKTGGADGGELTITVYDPAASFATMVQGDVVEALNQHIMLERSGFSNRVTYVRTTPMLGRRFEVEDEQPFNEGVRKKWNALVTNLLRHKDEDAPPIMLVLDEDAQAHRRTFHNALEARLAGDLADHAGLVAKWTTKTSKLAALFALIEECAESPLNRLLEGEDKQKRRALDVTGEHWLAAQSVSEWFLRSTIGVRQIAAELPEEKIAKIVLEFLRKHPGQWFYPREILSRLYRKGVTKVDQALAALGALHAGHLIERQEGRNVGSHRFQVRI